jgi:hypothetical protein
MACMRIRAVDDMSSANWASGCLDQVSQRVVIADGVLFYTCDGRIGLDAEILRKFLLQMSQDPSYETIRPNGACWTCDKTPGAWEA